MPNETVVSWSSQSVRSVVFSSELNNVLANELYVRAFNQQPSGYQSAGPTAPFPSSQATGHEREGLAGLQVNSGRADISIVPNQPVKPGTLPVLLDLGGSMDLIQKASTRLCKGLTKVNQLALIVDFVQPAEDSASASALLTSVLPFTIPVESTIDFLLQYTKRDELKSVNNLKINIVARWSTSVAEQFVFGPNAVQPSQKIPVASLLLDVNTLQEVAEIESAQAEAIFRGMREKIDAFRRGEPLG